ncbi:hypothetical protein BDR04DRAFT_1110027 [Suillus decipiens]|nr:hypothetical protein BDR04DRAFT_1110027 [Suillus decipiens]
MAGVDSVPLPDNAPTVGAVLAVVLIVVLLAIGVTYHGWKQWLPPFVWCGCYPCIIVHSEHEDAIPDIVELAIARLEVADAGLKEASTSPKEVSTS